MTVILHKKIFYSIIFIAVKLNKYFYEGEIFLIQQKYLSPTTLIAAITFMSIYVLVLMGIINLILALPKFAP